MREFNYQEAEMLSELRANLKDQKKNLSLRARQEKRLLIVIKGTWDGEDRDARLKD